MKRTLLLAVGLGVLLLMLPSAALASPTYDEAVDTLVQNGYPQRLTDHICSLGTSPMGFRFGGSYSDNQAARYIARQMRKIGLENVHLERVPADVYTFHWAKLQVGQKKFAATTFGGLAKSPSMGATGELVYVGLGTKAEFDAAGDVKGKIVLVDFASSYWWLNWPFHEAQYRGAKAVVFTTSPVDLSYYSLPETYGSNDSEASWSIPGIYVNRVTGDWLKEKLAKGSFKVTVRNHVVLKRAEKGGVGYNVVGTWPGSDRDAKKILFGAHHDAYFTGAIDNTTGIVGELVIAKALKMSGYEPRNTLKFVVFTHEEWGAIDSYYDFLMGSYRAIIGTARRLGRQGRRHDQPRGTRLPRGPDPALLEPGARPLDAGRRRRQSRSDGADAAERGQPVGERLHRPVAAHGQGRPEHHLHPQAAADLVPGLLPQQRGPSGHGGLGLLRQGRQADAALHARPGRGRAALRPHGPRDGDRRPDR